MSRPRIAKSLAICAAVIPLLFGKVLDGHAQTASQARIVWINPYNTVKVATGNCGGNLCGWVVWATPEAEQEAREGGVKQLVGTELLQNYRPTGPGTWQGRVFVPDMGKTYYSTIRLLNPNALKISGCIWGGLICKSQIWRRG